jgi:hypothetical protein
MPAPILDHYARILDARTTVLSETEGLTIAALAPTRDVMAEPTTRLVLTDGMSRRAMNAPEGAPARVELACAVPEQFEQAYACELAGSWLVDAMRELAAYPSRNGTWLGAGHTLPVGRPLAPQTEMTGLLLSMPLVLEDQRHWSVGDDLVGAAPEGPVHVLLVTPLYPGELVLARDQGTEALMSRLFSLVEAVGQDWSFFTLPQRPDTVFGSTIFA